MARPRRPRPPEPGDEQIRQSLLEYLYREHKHARSEKASFATMGDVKKAMKGLGVKQRRIVSNLLYLVQSRWVEEKTEAFNVYRSGRPILVRQTAYRVAASGIDRFEGPSSFQRVDRMAGINITNTQGVMVIGSDNIVRVRFEGLFRDLDALGTAIRASESLSDQEKISDQADIETIKTQLAKDPPDKNILQRAWESLRGVATLSGVAAAFDRVRTAIEPLLH